MSKYQHEISYIVDGSEKTKTVINRKPEMPELYVRMAVMDIGNIACAITSIDTTNIKED